MSIKSSLNWGLSDKLKQNSPGAKLRERPEYLASDKPLAPYWISGFTVGDGCFSVSITKTNQVITRYTILLSNRDVSLLICIQKFFYGIGIISENP